MVSGIPVSYTHLDVYKRQYLSKSENVVTSAGNVAIFDTLAALLAAFVIIPGMAVGGAELSSGGPGLMFVYLVNVFNLSLIHI